LDGIKRLTQAETNFVPKTLPYFVGDQNIKVQQLVCQEKNIILKEFACQKKNFYENFLTSPELRGFNQALNGFDGNSVVEIE
jgi:hypothetical protein